MSDQIIGAPEGLKQRALRSDAAVRLKEDQPLITGQTNITRPDSDPPARLKIGNMHPHRGGGALVPDAFRKFE